MEHADKQKQISDFLEIAVGESNETATRWLMASSWNIEEAINLYLTNQFSSYDQEELFSSYDDEEERFGTDSELSSLFRAPENLRFYGSFEDAKVTSYSHNLWLLVNLQSETEFACHALNRDLWSNEAVSEAIESSFILLQIYVRTTEGQKVSSFYKIESSPPIVLLIDPLTGGKLRMWSGQIDPQDFLADLMKYINDGPHQYIASRTSNIGEKLEKICLESNETTNETCSSSNQIDESEDHEEKREESTCSTSNRIDHKESSLEFPELTEELKGDCDRSMVCNLCVRFPDGRRKLRRFLKTEPLQLLWSFCHSHMETSERRVFRLVHAIPGASKTLDYGVNTTFDQSGLDNSMISVSWE